MNSRLPLGLPVSGAGSLAPVYIGPYARLTPVDTDDERGMKTEVKNDDGVWTEQQSNLEILT